VNQSIGSDQKGSGKFNGHKESRIVQLDTGGNTYESLCSGTVTWLKL